MRALTLNETFATAGGSFNEPTQTEITEFYHVVIGAVLVGSLTGFLLTAGGPGATGWAFNALFAQYAFHATSQEPSTLPVLKTQSV